MTGLANNHTASGTPNTYDRTDSERELAAMPTAASLIAASDLWDRYAPSHLRGLLRCQVATRPEAPPVVRATRVEGESYPGGAPFQSRFSEGLALFGLTPRQRDTSNLVYFYDPGEPRNAQGEWTSTGYGVTEEGHRTWTPVGPQTWQGQAITIGALGNVIMYDIEAVYREAKRRYFKELADHIEPYLHSTDKAQWFHEIVELAPKVEALRGKGRVSAGSRESVPTDIGLRYAAHFAYNPQETRKGKGDPEGGEWTAGGATGAGGAPATQAGDVTTAKMQALVKRSYVPEKRESQDVVDGYADWATHLTEDEQVIIDYYQKSGFDGFNRHLRMGTPAYPLMEIEPSTETGSAFEMEEGIDKLQHAIITSKAPANMRLYRGGRLPMGIKPGDIVQDDGFVSTSMDPDMSADFVTGYDANVDGLFEVDVPKGSPAASLDVAAWAASRGQFDQSEILLPHGSTFAFTGYDGSGKFRGQPIPRFVYLGPAPKQPSLAHFHKTDEPHGYGTPNRFVWQEGDLRHIGHVDLDTTVSFAYNPMEPRDEAGRWTTGGPHVEEARSTMYHAPTPVSTPPVSDKSVIAGLVPFKGTVAEGIKALDDLEVEWVPNNEVHPVPPSLTETALSVIVPVMQRVAALGLPLPKWVMPTDYSELGSSAVAAYRANEDTLVYNVDHPYWNSAAGLRGYMKEQSAASWFSTPSVFHIPMHEVGHEIAEKNGGPTYKYGSGGWPPEGWQGIAHTARKVSRYAATRPREYVAEVITGLMGGQQYPEDVMALYKKLGGPEINVARLEYDEFTGEPKGLPSFGEAATTVRREHPEWFDDKGVVIVGHMTEALKAIQAMIDPSHAEANKPKQPAPKRKAHVGADPVPIMTGPMPTETPDGKPVPELPKEGFGEGTQGALNTDKWLRQNLGINVAKIVTPAIAKYAAPLLLRMYAYGLPMPETVGEQADQPDAVAQYQGGVDGLYFNPVNDFWRATPEQQAKGMERQYKSGFLSTPFPEHIVVHEMAHELSFKYWDQLGMDVPPRRPPADERGTMTRVSRYASTDPVEFVAEVFTGLAFGQKYSEPVMKLYDKYHGPPMTWTAGQATYSAIAAIVAFTMADYSQVRIPMEVAA